MPKHRGWVASLNDGSTIFEGTYSWQDLKQLCQEPEHSITLLRLQYSGVTIIASKGDGYMYYDGFRTSSKTGKQTPVKALGTVLGDVIFLNLIDASRNIWQEVYRVTHDAEAQIIYTGEVNDD